MNDIHKAHSTRIESDYTNLQVAAGIVQDYLHKCQEDNTCFTSLMVVIEQVLELIGCHADQIEQNCEQGTMTEEEASLATSQEFAGRLLQMYFVGYEMGKARHEIWTHQILEGDEAVVEAEHILRLLR